MRRRVPKEHEYDETGQCKWCPHKDPSKASLPAPAGSAKPCEIPCPKCGGDDIHREHRGIGESVDKLDLDDDCKTIPPYLKSDWPYGYKVTKEHIGHTCRVCSYHWRTDILPNDQALRPEREREKRMNDTVAIENQEARSDSLERLVSELKADCNRYANGSCQTLACLKRGGYQRGDKPNYETATCERHEQVKALETLLANNELSDRC